MMADTYRADAVVVGAGIIGIMIAAHLVEARPAWRVVVLERGAVGSGATRFSAGLHFPYGRTETTRSFSRASEQAFEHLPAGPTRAIRPIRYIGVVSKARRAQEEACFTRPVVAADSKLELLADLLGTCLASADTDVFAVEGCHYAFPALVAEGLAAELRRHDRARIWEGARLCGVESRLESVVLTLADGRRLEARLVVLAVGPWACADPVRSLAAQLGVRVKKVVALHVDRLPRPDEPAIFFHDADAFLLPVIERGHWLFSFACQEWDVDPSEDELRITPRDRDDALTVLARYAPAWVERCGSGRVFCDAYGPADRPVVTPLPADQRIVFAGAANGSGYRLAPGFARAVGDLLNDREYAVAG